MMYLWDMMNARELVCEYQQSPSLGSGERIHKLTSFSPSLQSCVCLVVPAEERTKQRSSDALSKSPDFSLCSAVESDSQHLQVTPGSNSDMTNCSIQISNDVTEITPNDEMVNNGVETLPTGTGLQNASDTNISVHETSLPSIERERSGDGLSNFNVTETTKVPSDTPCSGNGVTYVYSTQIHIRSQSSGFQEQQKEVTNDGTRLKLPDINHSRPGRRPPSFASKHTTDNIQGKPRRGLMEHEGNMGRTGTSSGVSHAEFCVPVQVTSLCFVGEQEILAGTHAGHVLLLEVPSCNGVLAFGECGPTYGEEITQVFLKDAPRPHKCAVSYVTMSQDSNTFISSDSIAVCLWSAGDRSLIMKIEPCNDQKISHMVISKEAAIIAMATNSRTIYLWTPVERREIASYRTTFDITNLQMTCDCHKVVVRGLGPERNEILEIFDILNVDNILTHVAGRRQLQQIERREHLASERKTNRQQREKSSNKGKQ